MVGTGLHTGSLKCIIGNIKAKRMETRITRVFFKYALREKGYNLVPFEEIRRFIIYRNYVSAGAFLLNLFGNLLVFFPIGFLVPIWRLEKTGCIRIIIYAFLFSLCIETLQLITKVGVFDVDDLMMNTVGGLIGWIIYCIIRFIYHKWKAKNKKKEED